MRYNACMRAWGCAATMLLAVALSGCTADGPPASDPIGSAGGAPASGITPTGNFVVTMMDLGEVLDASGDPTVGLDLDGVHSAPADPAHCQLDGMALTPSEVKDDGTDGIDNSVARNVLPLALGAAAEPNLAWTPSIEEGLSTLYLRSNVLDGADTVDIYAYTTMPRDPPAHDGSDVFDIEAASIAEEGSFDAPIGKQLAVPIEGDSVTLQPERLRLTLNHPPYALSVTIHRPTIHIVFDETRSRIVRGLAGGVLDTDELILDVYAMLEPLIGDNCGNSYVANALRGAQDIVFDGVEISNPPGQPCNAISIGFAFEAVAASHGSVLDHTEPPRCSIVP